MWPGTIASGSRLRKRGFSLPNSSPSFRPHPNLSHEVNGNIVQSEMEGGVCLEDLQPGSTLQMTTHNTRYQLIVCWEYGADYRPSPVLPDSRPGQGSRLDLGWFDAQRPVHRSRYAHGIC